MCVVERARQFADDAHSGIGQIRKYTGEPYINHPAAVVDIIKSVDHTPAMLAAAWLHDVVEDTPVTLAEIDTEFGGEVSELVFWLTDVSKLGDGNRKFRKALDRAHLAKAPAEAQTIKLADLIDNTPSIVTNDPGFAKVYLEEKRLLLDVLTRGDQSLRQRACDLLETHL